VHDSDSLISMRYGFVSCAFGYNYILGGDVLRQYLFGGIQEHNRHVLGIFAQTDISD
jgi:hypothetical protein